MAPWAHRCRHQADRVLDHGLLGRRVDLCTLEGMCLCRIGLQVKEQRLLRMRAEPALGRDLDRAAALSG